MTAGTRLGHPQYLWGRPQPYRGCATMLRVAPQKSHCPPPKPGRFGCSHGEIKQKKTHLIAKAALYQVKATPRQNRAQSKLVPWRGQRHSHQLPGNEEKKGSFLPKKRRVRVPRLLFKGFSHSPSQLGKIRLGGMGVGPALPPPAHLEGGHHPQIIAGSPQNTPCAAWWCHAKSPQSPASP